MNDLAVLNAALPKPPPDLREVVELYAREYDRQGTLHFFMGCGWFANLSLRSNDKRLLLYQEGRAAKPPTEQVYFHVPNPNEQFGVSKGELERMDDPVLWPCISLKGDRCRQPFIPLDIVQMGPARVRDFLERGNLWSGRGEFDSLEEQLREVREKNQAAVEKFRQDQKEANRHEQRDKRRWRLKIPYLPVGIDLGKKRDSG